MHWLYTNGENLCKDICNRKNELKEKGEIIKRKRNYEKVDKNIWRVLKCKEIATLRDFLYKYWFVQFGFWSFFSHIIRIWKLLVRSVGTYTFLAKFYAYNWKPVFHVLKTSFFTYSCIPGRKSWCYGNMWHIFSKVKWK